MSTKISNGHGRPLLSVAEVANRLHVTPSYVRRLCRDDRLEGKKVGRDWFVVEESLDQLERRSYTRSDLPTISDDTEITAISIHKRDKRD